MLFLNSVIILCLISSSLSFKFDKSNFIVKHPPKIVFNESNINFCTNLSMKYPCIESLIFDGRNFVNDNRYDFGVMEKTPSISINVALNQSTKQTFIKFTEKKLSQPNFKFKNMVDFMLEVEYSVECEVKFQGAECDILNLCKIIGNNFCMNGGTCQSSSDSDVKCLCTDQYIGEFCEKLKDPCSKNLCYNGDCKNDNSKLGYSCLCKNKFSGTFCEKDNNECLYKPCEGFIDSKCINTYGSYQCVCASKNCTKETVPVSTLTTLETTTNIPTTITTQYSMKLIWPLEDLYTFILTGCLILFIVLMIIFMIFFHTKCCKSKLKRKKSYVDSNLLDPELINSRPKNNLELGPAYSRAPINSEDFSNRRSLTPIYDLNDFNTINDLMADPNSTDDYTNKPGMSTFGRRQN